MRMTPLLLAGVAVAFAGSGIAAAQTTVVQFEPQPCVLTLAPQYTADVNGFLQVDIPPTALSCPDGFAYNPEVDPFISTSLGNGAGLTGGPYIARRPMNYFDAAANAVMSKWVLQVSSEGFSSTISPATYDRFMPGAGLGVAGSYVTDAATSKNYRVVLGAPVTVTRAVASTPACRVSMPGLLTWRWGQAEYWVIPDSAIQCTGVTFSSTSMYAYVPFNSRIENQGYLITGSRQQYDPATGQYTEVRELRFYNWDTFFRRPASIAQLAGGAAGSTPTGATWGRFTLGNTDNAPTVQQRASISMIDTSQPPFYRISLAAPFTVKRQTGLKVSARRIAGKRIRVSITADRNTSFQNTTAPTYRRQTVLPGSRADQPVIKRGKTPLTRVRLSPYGTATVTIKDVDGRNPYSVEMAATDDNVAARARFVQ